MAKSKKQSIIPIKMLSIEGDGLHLSVKGKINGKAVHLLIDTGASRTVFDLNRVENFSKAKPIEDTEKLSTGLGTNTMKSMFTTLKKIQLGDLILENYETVLLDLSHVNSSYGQVGLKPIDGVIGSDILMNHDAIINYGKKQLTLTL
ncbi:MAG: retropepsin-like aspartic protease [Bacteroidia bacterium]